MLSFYRICLKPQLLLENADIWIMYNRPKENIDTLIS